MAATTLGERVKVYIQNKDGLVFEVHAYTTEVSMHQDYNGNVRTTIQLEAIDDNPRWVMGSRITENVQRDRQRGEWKCDYCGRANKFTGHADDETCTSCGSLRSFIYNL